MEDDDTFYAHELENLVIKDKEYYRKRRKKYILIFFLILFIIIAIAGVVVVYILFMNKGGKIICIYKTIEDNQNIILININETIDFNLKIDDDNHEKKYNHTFEKAGLHTIIFHFEEKLETLEGLFQGLSYLIEVDFSELKTDYIRSMENLFNSCPDLTKVNFDNITPNLKNISHMLYRCYSLITANLYFNTSKVTHMDYMLYYCENLKFLDLSSFKLENLINSDSMFKGCGNLEEIIFDYSTRTYNLQQMKNMFKNCQKLIKINTRIFKTNKLSNLNSVFNGCKSLKELNLSNFETENILEMREVFSHCVNLEKLDISHFNTSKVTKMDYMFYKCRKLIIINISNFELENLINAENMFGDCGSLDKIIFNNNTVASNLEVMTSMFNNCPYLKYINTKIFKSEKITDINYAFLGCRDLHELDLSFLGTDNVKEMKGIFQYCGLLEKIDVSHFNTSQVVSMEDIFNGCYKLKDLNILNFNTTNVISFENAFYGCQALTSLNFSSFDFKSVSNLDYMFYNCLYLEYLILPNKMPYIKTTNSMFENCHKLASINLVFLYQIYNWISAERMFKNCINLKELKFPTRITYLRSTKEMFSGCTDLKSIDLGSFIADTNIDMSMMFYECKNLKFLNISTFDTRGVLYYDEIFKDVGKDIKIIYDREMMGENIQKQIDDLILKTSS